MNTRYGGISKEYICPECSKLFLVPYQSSGGGKMQWVYRMKGKNRKTIYLCSYSCFLKAGERKEKDTYDGIHA